MQIPVTDALVEYIHDSHWTVQELCRRGGISDDAIYRVCHKSISNLSKSNSEKLAKALGVSTQELLTISVADDMIVADGRGTYNARDQQLQWLEQAWHKLCHEQKIAARAFIEGLLAQQKNTDRKQDQKTA